MNKIKFLTLGADPELFLKNEQGVNVSAEGLLGGSKDEPRKLSEQGHAVQEDNVMVEFNIPPVIDVNSFKRELAFCMVKIDKLVGDNLKLVVQPSMKFTKEELSTKQAKTFGCSPDFNAWTKTMIEPPIPPKEYRFAGGHIHLGWEESTVDQAIELTKCMDLFLAVPAVLMDDDELRKKVYGCAGRFRITDYGLEYRSLSNFWLKTTELQEWVFNQSMKSIDYINNNKIDNETAEKIQKCINSNDRKLAKELCDKFEIKIIEHERKIVTENTRKEKVII